ncbi:MAG: hypothetical protein MUO80_00345 [Dehalococcoidia bacterium]|nr:hypothetical protein [Dehalococcoidia bacterium]
MERKEICKFWASIGITAGLAIFFFGIVQHSNQVTGAWTDIGAGIFLIVIGFILAGIAGMFGKI